MNASVCDEDKQRPAVACCFCSFPLSTLCAEHLKQHDVENYTRFDHFHLPLHAAQLITTIESKFEYSKWLYRLHSAYSILRRQQQDIISFEQQLDSLAGEGLELQEVKRKVQALKTAFCAEVEAAIQATRSHCIDTQWKPDSLLAEKIWGFDLNHPEDLEVVQVRVQKPSLSVHITVYSSHPTLSQYNHELSRSVTREKERLEKNELLRKHQEDVEREKKRMHEHIEQLQSELQQIRARAEQGTKERNPQAAELKELENQINRLRTEMAAKAQQHAAEKEKLQRDLKSQYDKEKTDLEAKYRRERAELTSQSQAENQRLEATIERLKEEAKTFAAREKALENQCLTEKAQSAALKQRLEGALAQLRNAALVKVEQAVVVKAEPQVEIPELPNSSAPKVRLMHLSKSQKLKEQGKYEECCAVLEEGWGTVQSKSIKDKRTIAIGAAFTEALAIHQGRFEEAEAIANHALQIATENNISSKEVYELMNCKAALYCHSGKFNECIYTCKTAFVSSTKNNIEMRWTTLYYQAVASFHLNALSREETQRLGELSRHSQTADSSLSQVLMHFVSSLLLFHRREFQPAADRLSEAERIAVSKLSTSIHYAMICYFQGQVHQAMGRLDEARRKYAEADRQFSSISPASVFRVYCLSWISDDCKGLKKEPDSAIKHRRKIEEILSSYYPALIDRPLNLCKLAELLQASGQKDKAVGLLIDADTLFKLRFRGEACYRLNLLSLADLFEDLKLLEKAIDKRIEADQEYRKNDLTNLAYPVNLTRLADLYFNSGQRTKALEKRLEADAIFKSHHLGDINTALNLSKLGTYSSQMGRTEAEKYFSEAKNLFTANHPFTNDAASNLYHFANFIANRNRKYAIELLQNAFDIWANNGSDNAQKLAQPKLRELRGQK